MIIIWTLHRNHLCGFFSSLACFYLTFSTIIRKTVKDAVIPRPWIDRVNAGLLGTSLKCTQGSLLLRVGNRSVKKVLPRRHQSINGHTSIPTIRPAQKANGETPVSAPLELCSQQWAASLTSETLRFFEGSAWKMWVATNGGCER